MRWLSIDWFSSFQFVIVAEKSLGVQGSVVVLWIFSSVKFDCVAWSAPGFIWSVMASSTHSYQLQNQCQSSSFLECHCCALNSRGIMLIRCMYIYMSIIVLPHPGMSLMIQIQIQIPFIWSKNNIYKMIILRLTSWVATVSSARYLKSCEIKKNHPPNYHKRLAYESNINTICFLYDMRKNFKIRVS